LSVLAGYDAQDNQSINTEQPDYLNGLEDGLEGIRIGLAERYFLTGSTAEVADPVASCFERCAQLGAICHDLVIEGIEATNPLNVLLIATGRTRA
jgi:aspartyl-tRNA(Asn)/glutamyl-tRNA(Gln) amidotransferase subunit A